MDRVAQDDSGVRPTGGQRLMCLLARHPARSIRETGKGCAW